HVRGRVPLVEPGLCGGARLRAVRDHSRRYPAHPCHRRDSRSTRMTSRENERKAESGKRKEGATFRFPLSAFRSQTALVYFCLVVGAVLTMPPLWWMVAASSMP